MKKRYIFFASIFFLLFPRILHTLTYQYKMVDDIKIIGKITDEDTIDTIIQILKVNVNAINNKNIELYLSTISPEQRNSTEKEIAPILNTFDLYTTIERIEIISQNTNQIKLKMIQQTTNLNNEHYRDNQSTAGITFHLINNHWFIVESIMENTEFIYQ